MTGVLVLLYAQPLTRIAALQSTAITQADSQTLIALGKRPIPVPEPFASQLNYHLRHRPNLRTAGGAIGTPWLFPSSRPGWHLDPQTIMHRLRGLGINTLGSRNTALRELIAQVPAPLVVDMLGYSDQVTQKHAAEAGNTWAVYASTAPERRRVIPPQQRQRIPDGPRRSTGDQLTFDITDEPIDDRDTPTSPAQAHVDALDNAANTVAHARAAVAATEEELAQAVLRAHQSGLSWVKIAATVGISRQAAYQRWAALVRNPAGHDKTGDTHDPPDP